MADLRARTAGPGDIAALIALEPLAAGDANRQRFLRRSVNANECFLVERDSTIVAYGILNYSFFDHGFIASIVVAEGIRYSETIGVLMRYIESRCRTAKLFASTRNTNAALQNVLRKLQFEDCGFVKNIGADDDSEIFFYKYLAPDDSKVPQHHFGLG